MSSARVSEARSVSIRKPLGKRIRGAIDISRPVFGINQHAIAALTVPFIERLDRPQSPGVPDVAEHVREIASRISELMCFSGHNTLP